MNNREFEFELLFSLTERLGGNMLILVYGLEGQLLRLKWKFDPMEKFASVAIPLMTFAIINGVLAAGSSLEEAVNESEEFTKKQASFAHEDSNVACGVHASLTNIRVIREIFLTDAGRARVREWLEVKMKRRRSTAEFEDAPPMINQDDTPPCTTCGSIMVRVALGHYKCSNCGSTDSDELRRLRNQQGH